MQPILILSPEVFRAYIPVNKAFDIANLRPFIVQVQRDLLLPVLGRTLLNQLLLLVNDQTDYEAKAQQIITENANIQAANEDLLAANLDAAITPLLTPLPTVEQMQALLPYVLAPLAILSYEKYIPWNSVSIDNSGIRIISNDNEKTAFQWQINDLEGSAQLIGNIALEHLWAFLEENEAVYPAFASADVVVWPRELFIATAKEFGRYQYISESRMVFYKLFAFIRRVEQNQIRNLLYTDLFLELKAQVANHSLSAPNATLLESVREFVALKAMHNGLLELTVKFSDKGIMLFNNNNTQSNKVEQPAELERLQLLRTEIGKTAEAALVAISDLLEKNPDDYPLWRDSPLRPKPQQCERFPVNNHHSPTFWA
ncbi:hypothetical protein SAMN05421780_1195 [Flexibacter flexilis DSM 6793]|uniref:Uncharacterized protein n=1 Tax=Flexibacter flexilis DSM 6793 TaxID=927664 RepID=A0A1I1NTD6_9BACT|nr:DUF6712 family protein [Flexibacter flexilis]SFD00572.1 hypothetical protein SAMN05421780_1195 [Flexibacter flexilis DSM 6793]